MTYPSIKTALADIQKKIKTDVDAALLAKVFPAISDLEQKDIQEMVYDQYSPEVYERRTSGGLSDPSNIKGKLIKPGVLEVTNETPPNPVSRDGATTNKKLPELIEYGEAYYQSMYPGDNGYDYPGQPYAESRNFTKLTALDLELEKGHVAAMKKGLQSKGWNMK